MRIPKIGDHVSYPLLHRVGRLHGYVMRVDKDPFSTNIRVWCKGWTEKRPEKDDHKHPTYMFLEGISIHTPEEILIDEEYEALYD